MNERCLLSMLLCAGLLAGCYESHRAQGEVDPDLGAPDDGASPGPAGTGGGASGSGGAAGDAPVAGAASDPDKGGVDENWGPSADAVNEGRCDAEEPFVLEIDPLTRWGRIIGWLESTAEVSFLNGIPRLSRKPTEGLNVAWTVSSSDASAIEFVAREGHTLALAPEPDDFEAIDLESLSFAGAGVGPVGPGAIVVHRSPEHLVAVRVDAVCAPVAGAERCTSIDATWVFATADEAGRLAFGAPVAAASR